MEATKAEKSLTVSQKVLLLSTFIICAYHMLSTFYIVQEPTQHQIVSLGSMIFAFFFSEIFDTSSRIKKFLYAILGIVGIFCLAYLYIHYGRLQDSIGFPETRDIIVGAALIMVVIVGTWMSWGSVFPILAIVLILYFFFGHYLPKPLYHSKIPGDLVMSYLVVGFSGIFGSLLGVMASFGSILLVFGALLEVGGANKFFLEVGKLAGRRLSGGPGQTAVVGSSLVGMVSGGAIGNVIITGNFTIPMMKQVGFTSESAGAIEATASTGSQLMPPIMGIAAFLMAGFLGVDYSVIMIAGLTPSLLFYLSVAWGVQLIAKKEKVETQKESVDRAILINHAPLFIIPLAVLILMLMNGLSAGLSGVTAILLTVVLMYLRKSTRPSMASLFEGIKNGIIMASKITLAVCAVGMVSQVFITTGLAQKLASFMATISFGIPALTLFFTMILSLILGLGLPATAAYSLVAILVVPGLTQMGIEPIRAHFFAFYFAIISAVTPPVALASMAAASIAEASFMKTSFEATKLSAANFIIPFLVIYNPVFLLRPDTPVLYGVMSIISAVIAVLMFESFLYNYLLCPLRNFVRLLLLIGIISCIVFCINTKMVFFVFGVASCVLAFIFNARRRAQLKILNAE